MIILEDLRKWVAEKWVDIGAPKKGGGFKPCGRQKGEKRKGYPKCVPLAKANSMSKGQRQSAVKRKRARDNKGPKPDFVATMKNKKVNESVSAYVSLIYSLFEGKGVMPKMKMGVHKDPKGGLTQKGVNAYKAANPGSKLKMAVTTKPSKLKKGSKAANRRKSFCARMGGMKKRLTSAKTANDPDSRINKALRKWNC